MQCSKCNSENTQRLEVVFEGGTSVINTQSHSAGAGVGGGAFGAGGVTTNTHGTSQTVLGRKASPPSKKSYAGPVISVIMGVLFIFSGSVLAFLFGLLLAGAGGYFINSTANYNKIEWPPLYKCWKESWLCHKCGNIYHQP